MEFILEPEILKERSFDPLLRNEEIKETKEAPPFDPASFVPHAGIDESGKGDFFGPLVISCAFVPDAETAKKLLDAGVKDSKQIKSDAAILKTASLIRNI